MQFTLNKNYCHIFQMAVYAEKKNVPATFFPGGYTRSNRACLNRLIFKKWQFMLKRVPATFLKWPFTLKKFLSQFFQEVILGKIGFA